jgi:hypothetical protein
MCIELNNLNQSVYSGLYIGKDSLHGLTPRRTSGKNSGFKSLKKESTFPPKEFNQNVIQGYPILYPMLLGNRPRIHVGGCHWLYGCISHPERLNNNSNQIV